MDIAGIMIYMVVGGITPGPNNIMSMYLGARCGVKGARRFIVGSMSSVFVKMLLCGLLDLALAAVLPATVPYLKWLGAAYMAYLGIHILLAGIKEKKTEQESETGNEAGNEAQDAQTSGSTYRDGILLQLLNIKSWIYALSIFSIYVVPYSRSFFAILLWALVATAVLIVSTLLWTLFGAVIGRLYAKYRLPCDIVMCLSLLYCAVTAVM